MSISQGLYWSPRAILTNVHKLGSLEDRSVKWRRWQANLPMKAPRKDFSSSPSLW